MKITTQLTYLASAMTVGLIGLTPATAAAPATGTQITNFATATYQVNGNLVTTQSNTVQITVGDAPSFELTQNQEQTINKNTGEVTFTHTIKNTGNTDDTYTLAITNNTGDQLDYESFTIYPEDPANPGQPKLDAPIAGNKITVAAGNSTKFFIVAKDDNIGTFKDGNTGSITVEATNKTLIKQTNQDTGVIKASNLVIAKSATITVDKATIGSAENNDEITYSIKFGNTSTSTAADNVIIVDTLPEGVTYVANSAKIDGTAVAAGNLTIVGQKIVYKFGTVAANTNTTNAPAGNLTFKVKVTDESKAINNVAAIGSDVNKDNIIDEATPATSTVTTPNGQTKITGTINESLTDAYSDAQIIPGNADRDNQITKEVIITNATSSNATSGAGNVQLADTTVTFEVYVHNTGNLSTDFDLAIDTNQTQAGQLTNITFPATTGDIAPGAAQKVTVTATIPAGTILQDNQNYPVSIKVTPKGAMTSDNVQLIVNAQRALELLKRQAVIKPVAGQSCSTVASQAAGKYNDVAISKAAPGDCIFYQITATNFYPSTISKIILSDTLNASVLNNSTMAISPVSTKGTASFNSTAVVTTEFDLATNESAVLTFTRQINAN
jgi:uncharacterized repeat protein (TIGR01451 family)